MPSSETLREMTICVLTRGCLELSEFRLNLAKLLLSQKGQGGNINLRLCLTDLCAKPQSISALKLRSNGSCFGDILYVCPTSHYEALSWCPLFMDLNNSNQAGDCSGKTLTSLQKQKQTKTLRNVIYLASFLSLSPCPFRVHTSSQHCGQPFFLLSSIDAGMFFSPKETFPWWDLHTYINGGIKVPRLKSSYNLLICRCTTQQ